MNFFVQLLQSLNTGGWSYWGFSVSKEECPLSYIHSVELFLLLLNTAGGEKETNWGDLIHVQEILQGCIGPQMGSYNKISLLWLLPKLHLIDLSQPRGLKWTVEEQCWALITWGSLERRTRNGHSGEVRLRCQSSSGRTEGSSGTTAPRSCREHRPPLGSGSSDPSRP